MNISNEQLLEKYARLWNYTYWEIQRFQIINPGQEHLLRETEFELEVMERAMEKLIPNSFLQEIKSLIRNV
jgi:hypothetical protein